MMEYNIRMVRVSDEEVLTVALSNSFWPRLRGLLWVKELTGRQGLLIQRCSSIHTIGMNFTIDVVFLDQSLNVLSLVEEVRPWKTARSTCGLLGSRFGFWSTTINTLEIASGGISRFGITLNDQFKLESKHDIA